MKHLIYACCISVLMACGSATSENPPDDSATDETGQNVGTSDSAASTSDSVANTLDSGSTSNADVAVADSGTQGDGTVDAAKDSVAPTDVKPLPDVVVAVDSAKADTQPPPTDSGVPSWQQLYSQYFQPECASCHSANARHPFKCGPDAASCRTSIIADKNNVLAELRGGGMPPSGPAISSTQLAAVEAWFAAGAPNN